MFAFRLADRWGMPVRELLARVDSRELTKWMAYEQVRPPSREEEINAQLCHWLGCLWMERPYALDRFLPGRHKGGDKPQSSAEKRAKLRGL